LTISSGRALAGWQVRTDEASGAAYYVRWASRAFALKHEGPGKGECRQQQRHEQQQQRSGGGG
jgi:hypothetical protein